MRFPSMLMLSGLSLSAPAALAQIIYVDQPVPLPRPAPDFPPPPHLGDRLPLRQHRAEVEIRDGLARTTIRQTFHNEAAVDLEGHFVFPVPPRAAVQDFRLVANGKELRGEVLDRSKAREIYESIVRRRRDPGLLEYLGHGILQASVFPIPARSDLDVVLSYSEVLDRQGDGLFAYRQPIAGCQRSWSSAAQIVLSVELVTQASLKMLFCPSHRAEIVKQDDHHARISFEGREAQRDFTLLYSTAQSDFGVTLLSYRRPGEDGYFALTVSPELKAGTAVQPKDLVFVVDKSGSMNGEKMQQARDALKFCLRGLHPGDRFNLIAFSTEVQPFAERLVEVNDDNIARALAHVDHLEASGGTNIRDALVRALQDGGQSDGRLFEVLFMTDGLPTIGVIEPAQILGDFRAANARSVRLFAFGVGNDVNTFLLDKLAEENRGSRDYVAPSESIEVKVSSWFAKASQPALVDVKLAFDGIDCFDFHPSSLPDIFRGSDLVIIGRYRGDGNHAIKLAGRQAGVERSWETSATFAKVDETHDYLPRLWAARKVGYLLDQIRLHGPNKEIEDDVVRLAKQFGIVTPYTSNLVVEESELKSLAFSGGPGARDQFAQRVLDGEVPQDRLRSLGYIGRSAGNTPAATGAAAVESSESARVLQSAQAPLPAAAPVRMSRVKGEAPVSLTREVDGHVFYLIAGVWTDQRYLPADKDKITRVKAFSDEYFKLLDAKPALRKYFAIDERVLVKLDDQLYEVE
ncbi:MAG: VIT domain-containing protein [Planctomycetota bacterium]